jgi:hypothetical protein
VIANGDVIEPLIDFWIVAQGTIIRKNAVRLHEWAFPKSEALASSCEFRYHLLSEA